MPSDRELAAGGGTVAILGIPAYMGWAGLGLGAFLSYALVAGVALATADRFAVSHCKGESAKTVIQHAILRTVGVTVVGGLVYAVARIAF